MPPKSTKKTTKSEKATTPKAKATTKSKPKAKAKVTPKAKPKAAPKTKAPAKPKRATKAKPKAKPTTAKAKPKTTTKTLKVDDYEALLTRAREQIPPEVFEQPRFRVPRVDSFIQGTRTVIRNFKDITDTIRRDPKHLLRYLSHELATAGEVRSGQAIFNGRFNSRSLEELMGKYTEEFVVCPVCQRPDTEIRREDRLLMLVCSACGGRTPLKG